MAPSVSFAPIGWTYFEPALRLELIIFRPPTHTCPQLRRISRFLILIDQLPIEFQGFKE